MISDNDIISFHVKDLDEFFKIEALCAKRTFDWQINFFLVVTYMVVLSLLFRLPWTPATLPALSILAPLGILSFLTWLILKCRYNLKYFVRQGEVRKAKLFYALQVRKEIATLEQTLGSTDFL